MKRTTNQRLKGRQRTPDFVRKAGPMVDRRRQASKAACRGRRVEKLS